MLTLKGRQDGFRLLLPKEFLCVEIEQKYTEILQRKRSYLRTPIDFVNETIQRVDVLGFQNATVQQQQSTRGDKPLIKQDRVQQNEFMFPESEFNYRSEVSPIALTDRTFNIEFRHTLGYLNYFILYENFWYQFSRDRNYDELCQAIYIDIFNEKGTIYSRIRLDYPLINSMDMLSFDYTQPVASSQTFKIEIKYSNFDFEFIDIDGETENSTVYVRTLE